MTDESVVAYTAFRIVTRLEDYGGKGFIKRRWETVSFGVQDTVR